MVVPSALLLPPFVTVTDRRNSAPPFSDDPPELPLLLWLLLMVLPAVLMSMPSPVFFDSLLFEMVFVGANSPTFTPSPLFASMVFPSIVFPLAVFATFNPAMYTPFGEFAYAADPPIVLPRTLLVKPSMNTPLPPLFWILAPEISFPVFPDPMWKPAPAFGPIVPL